MWWRNSTSRLIDSKSFAIVQDKLKSRQRPGKTGKPACLPGLSSAASAGKSLTIRTTHAKHPQQIYACKTYGAFGKNHCTQHRVKYDTPYHLVLNKIRECAKAALTDGEAIAGKLTNTCEAEQKGQREALERSLTKDAERIEVLEKLVLRLYEDMVAGRISEANFDLMLDKTQKEQAELKERVAQGRKKLADEMRLAMDAKQWVDAVAEYADITELDAAALNRLIKEIVVHEHIDSDKTRHISIEIHFNLKPIRRWNRSRADLSPPGRVLKTIPYILTRRRLPSSKVLLLFGDKTAYGRGRRGLDARHPCSPAFSTFRIMPKTNTTRRALSRTGGGTGG